MRATAEPRRMKTISPARTQGWLTVLAAALLLGSTVGAPVTAAASVNGPATLDASAIAWMFVVVRIAGSALVVPHLEEVFYRSFLYRYIANPNFQSVPLGSFHWKAFLITAVIFGLAHYEWLAGILCAFAYQGLVCWKGRLGDAMTAHAITNLLLGLWVVWKGAWNFW